MLERLLRRQRLLSAVVSVVLVAAGCAALAGAAVFGNGFFCCPGIFLLIGGPCLFVSWQHLIGKWAEPLAAYGGGDPWQALRRIDAEIAVGHDVRLFGTPRARALSQPPGFVVLTPRWLIRVGPSGITALPVADMLWVFLRHCRTDAERPPHQKLGLRIYCRDDRWERIPLDDPAEMDEPLAELLRRCPGVAVGYHDELLKVLAEGQPSFVERVEREGAEWSSLAPEEREARHADKLLRLHEEEQKLARLEDDPFEGAAWAPRPPYGVGRGWSVAAAWKLRPQLGETLFAERLRPFAWAALSLVLGAFSIPLIIPMWIAKMLGRNPFGDEQTAAYLILALVFAALWTWAVHRFVHRGFARSFRRRLDVLGGLEVIARVDQELRGDNVWISGSPPHASLLRRPNYTAVTRSWLLQVRRREAVLVPLRELVWVYKRRHPGTNWLRDVRIARGLLLRDRPDEDAPSPGLQYELGCRTRDGADWYVVAEAEEDIDRLFEEILERRPAVLVGWGGECFDLMERGPHAVTAAYDQRAFEFEKLPLDKREEWFGASWKRYAERTWNME